MRWHDRVAHRIPRRLVLAFAHRYIAGPSLDDALRVADDLWASRRIRSTLDVLGEQVTSPEQARAALEAYMRAAEGAAARPHVSLSFKPGHFGQLVEPALCERQARDLAARCERPHTRLTIDMEDTDLTDATLALYRRLRPEFPGLGLVLQSRLFRTAEDVENLAGLDARVRLCIGAYDVSGEMGYGTRYEAKENLLRLLPRLLDVATVVEIATHDRALVERIRGVLARREVARERIEFQMLMGVPRRKLQDALVADGWTVRLYVPYAESWDDATAYLRRRLVETPSIAGLALRNLFGTG